MSDELVAPSAVGDGVRTTLATVGTAAGLLVVAAVIRAAGRGRR